MTRAVTKLAALVAVGSVTEAEFHDARRVASRQVASYDTLHTIQPDDEYYLMSRSLAAINGLMGDMHDQLVLDRAAGVRDYHRGRFQLPDEKSGRITALVDRHRMSGLRC